MTGAALPSGGHQQLRLDNGDTCHFVEAPLHLSSLHLTIRNSVAVRAFALENRTAFYLSLFDDQIDGRLEQFLASMESSSPPLDGLYSARKVLQPTDALVVFDHINNRVIVARGGACRFPLYWASKNHSILVSTRLPLEQNRFLSRRGLLAAVAVVTVSLQNEPNFSLCTPLPGWNRFRRGAVSTIDSKGQLSEIAIDLAEFGGPEADREQLITSIRSAFDTFGSRLKNCSRLLVELSGGFDSTLAAMSAQKYGVEVHGVSVRFPYYEFRFEEEIQQDVAKALSIDRSCLDGPDLLPYAPSEWQPKLDEPATTIMSVQRDLAIAKIALRTGVDKILVGQGGDQIFSEDMLQPVPCPSPLTRNAFSNPAWQEIERVRTLIQSTPVFLRRTTLTYLHDARLDVALKESFGPISISPFSELEMVSCALSWARLSAREGTLQGKRILAEAFAEDLPDAVVNRRSKVSWDGVCARAYAKHRDNIVSTLESSSAMIEKIGFEVKWLVKRANSLARWETTRFGKDDRELFAAYALAMWLKSWGMERVSDCDWCE